MSKCDYFFRLDEKGNKDFIDCSKKCPYYTSAMLIELATIDMKKDIGYCLIRDARLKRILNELHYEHLANGTALGTVL